MTAGEASKDTSTDDSAWLLFSSAFNFVSEDPPLIVLGLRAHDDDGERSGEIKDTTRSILRTSEFVVNLLDENFPVDMVATVRTSPRLLLPSSIASTA